MCGSTTAIHALLVLLALVSTGAHAAASLRASNGKLSISTLILDDAVNTRANTNTNATLRPIIFLHGINGHATEFIKIIQFMKYKYGPERAPIMHSLAMCEGSCSLLTPLPQQREDLTAYLVTNAVSLGIEKGFHFIAHSQGALLARSVIQKLPPTLRVYTYVSMAGPQRGQWGECSNSQSGIGPEIAAKMARPVGWLAFYNPVAQRELSFANYWFDPGHYWLFRREASFLPEINGYVQGDMAEQKAKFLSIQKAVFLGSSDDDCINPPLSSVFQFVDENGDPTPFEQSLEYIQDTFGLKTMQDEGRLVVKDVPGQDHMSWLLVPDENSTQKISLFELYVLPHLM